jgi:hypothetical protein
MRNLAFVLLAACSGSTPVKLEFDVTGPPPTLFTYRDGNGAWLTEPPDANGHYTLTVTDDYQVVIACVEQSYIASSLVSATVEDGPQQTPTCIEPSYMTPTTYPVTGTMKQPGTVFLYDSASSQTPNWAVDLDAPAGTHDLLAIDNQQRMMIRRGLAIAGATTLDPIDLTGAPTMAPITLQIANAGSDSVEALSNLRTATGIYFLSSTGSTQVPPRVWTAPASLLESSDTQEIAVDASTNQGQERLVMSPFTGSETSFTLPDEITGVTFGTASVGWTAMPVAYDNAGLALDQDRYPCTPTCEPIHVTQLIRATTRWLATAHATKLTFDAQPPGFQTAWTVDPTASYDQELTAYYVAGNVEYDTFVHGGAANRQRPNRPIFSPVDSLHESMRLQHTMR